MRSRGSDRLVLAALAVLAASSLVLKAAAGPPRDGLMDISRASFDQKVGGMLRGQAFSIEAPPLHHRSPLIRAVKGRCRIAVGDARDGAAVATAIVRDAQDIGTVHYLYRGESYEQPPTFAMRLGRIETEVKSRLGLSAQAAMPVALATSVACGDSDFGLADVRI